MNILFITFGYLSVGEGAVRSVSILRALADAGHHVDVASAGLDMAAHPNIRVLTGDGTRPASRRRIRLSALRAMSRTSYQVVHAVDEAVIYVTRLSRLKRIHIVYEASRCFTGTNAVPPSFRWKLFPDHYHRLEKKALKRTSMILSSCDGLSADLRKLREEINIQLVEDIPAHALLSTRKIAGYMAELGFEGGAGFIVACRVLPGNNDELRTLLLSARKVIERIPDAGFIFKGIPERDAQTMATNLDIHRRCIFLHNDEPERFLGALALADAALFVPSPGCRYPHPEIFTLLNSRALVVAVHDAAYSSLLHAGNSIQVDYTAISISEGLLRVYHEPLISYGIVADAQQLIADRYSYSSFKHRIRMAYYEMSKT